MTHQFLLIFFHEVRELERKKNDRVRFLKKKERRVRRTQKVPKRPKIEIFGVRFIYQNLIHACVPFLLEDKISKGPLTICKYHISGENLVVKLWSKNLKPIRMQDSLNYNISQTRSVMILSFFM